MFLMPYCKIMFGLNETTKKQFNNLSIGKGVAHFPGNAESKPACRQAGVAHLVVSRFLHLPERDRSSPDKTNVFI
jgi:hypothetical protein